MGMMFVPMTTVCHGYDVCSYDHYMPWLLVFAVNSNYYATDRLSKPTTSQLDRAATVMYHQTV